VFVYDKIVCFYDLWLWSVVEDVFFYLDEVCCSGGLVFEFVVGIGWIVVLIVVSGILVVGVDFLEGML